MNEIQEAHRVIDIEVNSLLALKERLNGQFSEAIDMLMRCEGKVIVTGMGKSGHIGQKMASTLSSTGTPAIFLHPAESAHGDLGVLTKTDVLIVISYGGESDEIYPILKFAQRKGIHIIAMTGNLNSTLANSSQVALDISVKEEACPLKLAPTASTMVTLALGDALAMVLLGKRDFKKEDFAEFHPGGSLGRKLITKVKDVMCVGEASPIVKKSQGIKEVLTLMTSKKVRGVACVIDDEGSVSGVITDGDIRRHLEKGENFLNVTIEELMSKSPKTIDQEELAEKALFVMDQFRIQNLIVINKTASNPKAPVGILDLQDLIEAKLR